MDDPKNPEAAALKIAVFELMEQARGLAGISAYRLCQAAKVDQVTHSRLKKRPWSWQLGTMRRFIRALQTLQAINEDERQKLAVRISDLDKKPSSTKREAA